MVYLTIPQGGPRHGRASSLVHWKLCERGEALGSAQKSNEDVKNLKGKLVANCANSTPAAPKQLRYREGAEKAKPRGNDDSSLFEQPR